MDGREARLPEEPWPIHPQPSDASDRHADLNAFLVRFSDAVRSLHDPVAVAATACRMVFERLGVERAYWGEVDWTTREWVIKGASHAAGAPVIEGRFPLEGWEPNTSLQFAGRSVVVHDTQADPRLPDSVREGYAQIEVGADLAVPVLVGGILRSTLSVNQREPRRWTPQEISFVEGIAGRCWAEVERARAEAALRESEEHQSFLLSLSDAMRPLVDPVEVQSVALRTLAEHLGLSRGAYWEIQEDQDRTRKTASYNGALPPLPSETRISDFSGDQLASYLDGRPFVVSDTETDPRVAATREATRAIGVRAWVGVPLLKGGRLLVVLGVEKATPHAWTEPEVRLLQEAAERTWAATERAVAEAARRDSEERFRLFGEAASDVLWIRRADDLQWIYLSPAFESIYGRDRASALAGDNLEGWAALILPEDREHALGHIERARAGERVTFEYRIRRPDGTVRWLRDTDFPIADPGGAIRHIGGIGQDVTEEKALELERSRQLDRERAAREAAEAFLAVMSHELKTPVTAIYGEASLLARDPARPDAPDLASDIQVESDRLVRIIDDLLVLSGVDRGLIRLSPEPIALRHVLDAVVESVTHRFPGIAIRSEVASEVPPVLADPTALRQVLHNLLTNAAKYAGAAGDIEVRTAAEDGRVAIEVLDRGPGPGTDPEALFDLFYRSPHTERIASGTGIGLYVARQLMTAMGGTLDARARGGGGAAFRVTVSTPADDGSDATAG